jgi:hypothetical protein
MQRILERPQIELVHRPIIQVRADRCVHANHLPVCLLLVSDKVFHAGDGGLLHASNCLENELAGEIGVVTEAFPVAGNVLMGGS